MSPSGDAPGAVRCLGVSKAYGPAGDAPPAVREASFEARCGEITFITGPSGCGKTTLVSMIGGVLSPTRGEIVVLGRSLSELTPRELAGFRARVVGFVFQQLHLIPTLTARENVAVPLVVQGRRRREADEAAQGWLDRLGLGGHGDRHPRELSGGQQQRVAVARALVHDPRLVICDEPTAALDAEAGRGVMEILRRHALDPGRAVLVVTHDPRILRPGDRIVSMDDGRIDRVAIAA